MRIAPLADVKARLAPLIWTNAALKAQRKA